MPDMTRVPVATGLFASLVDAATGVAPGAVKAARLSRAGSVTLRGSLARAGTSPAGRVAGSVTGRRASTGGAATRGAAGEGSVTGRRPGGPGGGLGGLRCAEIMSGSSSIGIVFEVAGGGLREGMPLPRPGALSSVTSGRVNSDAAESAGLLCDAAAGAVDFDDEDVADDEATEPPAECEVAAAIAGAGFKEAASGGVVDSTRSGGAGSGSSSISTSMSMALGVGGNTTAPAGSLDGRGTCTGAGRGGSSTMIASKRSAASRGKSSS